MKKRSWAFGFFVLINAAMLYAAHVFLAMGQRAQETFNYSSIKDLEVQGTLTTNISTVVAVKPGANLIHLNVLGQFYLIVNVLLVLLFLANSFFAFYILFPEKFTNSDGL